MLIDTGHVPVRESVGHSSNKQEGPLPVPSVLNSVFRNKDIIKVNDSLGITGTYRILKSI